MLGSKHKTSRYIRRNRRNLLTLLGSSGYPDGTVWFQDEWSVTSDTLLSAHTPDIDLSGNGYQFFSAVYDGMIYNNTIYGDVMSGTVDWGLEWAAIDGPGAYAKTITAWHATNIASWTEGRFYIGLRGTTDPTVDGLFYNTGINVISEVNDAGNKLEVALREATAERASVVSTNSISANTAYKHVYTDDNAGNYSIAVTVGATTDSDTWNDAAQSHAPSKIGFTFYGKWNQTDYFANAGWYKGPFSVVIGV